VGEGDAVNEDAGVGGVLEEDTHVGEGDAVKEDAGVGDVLEEDPIEMDYVLGIEKVLQSVKGLSCGYVDAGMHVCVYIYMYIYILYIYIYIYELWYIYIYIYIYIIHIHAYMHTECQGFELRLRRCRYDVAYTHRHAYIHTQDLVSSKMPTPALCEPQVIQLYIHGQSMHAYIPTTYIYYLFFRKCHFATLCAS
jgi:hypothetical protein